MFFAFRQDAASICYSDLARHSQQHQLAVQSATTVAELQEAQDSQWWWQAEVIWTLLGHSWVQMIFFILHQLWLRYSQGRRA